MAADESERLSAWKEIAAFIGRDERTAMRWAAQQGMPVHHIPGGKRGRLFALREEISMAGPALEQATFLRDRTKRNLPTSPQPVAADVPRRRSGGNLGAGVTCGVVVCPPIPCGASTESYTGHAYFRCGRGVERRSQALEAQIFLALALQTVEPAGKARGFCPHHGPESREKESDPPLRPSSHWPQSRLSLQG